MILEDTQRLIKDFYMRKLINLKFLRTQNNPRIHYNYLMILISEI